jgi:hypothetical protein
MQSSQPVPEARPSVRVRGIYATALSALLPAHGFAVVEASPVIADRLGLPTDGRAEVQLSDRPDHQAVRLEGAPEAAGALARGLAGLLPDAVPRWLRGLSLWEVEFPGGSKRALDAARAAVWPTLPGHHQLKIVAQAAVDRAERSLAAGRGAGEALTRELAERYLEHPLRPGRDVVAEHVKPHGRELKLPGRVVSLRQGRLRLSRGFRQGGTYDTLEAPKRGDDRGEVEQLAGSWVSLRRYLRADGSLIGELYNIQTPTELYPYGVRYLDLEVDVARWPDGRVEVVDRAELEDAVRAGYVSEALAQRAVEVAEGVAASLKRGQPVELADWC